MPEITSHINKDLGPLPRPDPRLPEHVLELFSLKGKVASITGSSLGIGYSVAEAYAQAGADVAIWYNTSPADDKAAELAAKYGVKCIAYKCAIGDATDVANTIKQQVEDFGTIDIFVANAGVPWRSGPLVELAGGEGSDAAWHRLVNIDLDGVYYCAKNIGKIFQKQGSGSFIITASMSGHVVNVPQKQSAYNAVKAACLHLGKSLAVEWSHFARVNTISPGYIVTPIAKNIPQERIDSWLPLIPMGRRGLPQELVGAYLYLASDASTYTTGTDIIVDGGYCAP
ncbi:hypothetical protein BABINDRAFT_160569 [Babjeviella inositovora NRRL Y-12698]|uniref:Sorbose reductase SOU1 n=1 Tax=Babjeviella inositovora NRRL Y-12698 TaxID=984486 RepID=A0A1E3QU06_9ASCO|nr:uncharacterized protein BABINDRAFT_160569 [Babjeviella inositovora NRRL Y-12698]ODQ81176.1 hypothetical protein BABINDRAFT_160569 [Babjeviella inositovora NRRL Y-12698]